MNSTEQATTLELTPEQRETLAAVLDNYLSDLRYEIADTDGSQFKHMLQHRRQTLMEIAAALRVEEVAATG